MTEAIIDVPVDVTGYVDQVRQLADANRDALGFLPATAYEEAAMKGCLWVAVEGCANKLRGYLFFGVLPGLAWVEVEPSAVKIDRRREV